ncbi:Methionine--tRNA ligase, mitochondrial [Marasmius crinis-equi]|uniref:Methionine--tRNA ligase, mitochondrial n=1 Tax=Marasmius crinis-equi TaxID=585013 RepID=A0ABR3ERF1_9AGAR
MAVDIAQWQVMSTEESIDILSDGEEEQELAKFAQKRAQFIGRGVKYSDTIPSYVRIFCVHSLKIPKEAKSTIFPADDIPISLFVSQKLPEVAQSLVFPDVKAFLSTHPPTSTGSDLHLVELPPMAAIQKLQKPGWLEQQILDGIKSIMNPSYSSCRFPLWAVEAWYQLHTVVEKQRKWKDCTQWLRELARLPTAMQPAALEAQRHLSMMGWNEALHLRGSGTNDTTSEFSWLVSDTRISGTLIDLMCYRLIDQLESNNEVDRELMILPRTFTHDIIGAETERDHAEPRTKYLRQLEQQVHALNTRYLVFPVFNKQLEHWLACQVDLRERTVTFGDSLAHEGVRPPKTVGEKLVWWLEGRFDGKFRVLPDQLDHGQQDNYVVCGMVAVNTIAHRALGAPLWTVSRKAFDRAKWFETLCEAHITSTSPPENKRPTVEQSSLVQPALSCISRQVDRLDTALSQRASPKPGSPHITPSLSHPLPIVVSTTPNPSVPPISPSNTEADVGPLQENDVEMVFADEAGRVENEVESVPSAITVQSSAVGPEIRADVDGGKGHDRKKRGRESEEVDLDSSSELPPPSKKPHKLVCDTDVTVVTLDPPPADRPEFCE